MGSDLRRVVPLLVTCVLPALSLFAISVRGCW